MEEARSNRLRDVSIVNRAPSRRKMGRRARLGNPRHRVEIGQANSIPVLDPASTAQSSKSDIRGE